MKAHVLLSVWAVFVLSVSGHRDGGLTFNDYKFIDNKLTSYGNDVEPLPSKTRPSLSCILFGDVGCQGTCNVMCALYGCTSNGICRNGMYCECNEVYHFQNRDVPADNFATLPFDQLWRFKFANSAASTAVRNQLKSNPQMMQYAIDLLRDPHMTGDDIRAALLERYPGVNELRQLQSIPQGAKQQIASGGVLEYDNLGEYFGDLFEGLRQGVRNIAYKKRLMKMLRNIDSKEELEYLQKQILMSGNEQLYHFVNSYLRRRGIDFEDNSVEFIDRVCGKRRRRQANRWGKGKPGKFQNDFDSVEDQRQRQRIKKKVVLQNADQPFEVYTNEDDLIEQTVINQLLNPAQNDVATPSSTAEFGSSIQNPQRLPSSPSNLPSTFNSLQNQLPSSLTGTWPLSSTSESPRNLLPTKLDNWQTNVYNLNNQPSGSANLVQSNTPTIPNSLLQNFPMASIAQPDWFNGLKSRKPQQLGNGNVGGRFPNVGFGDSLRASIEDKMKQQKQRMAEMELQAANNDGDDNTHTTYTHNFVSSNVVANEVDGKKTQFESQTVENVYKNSDRPETNVDQSVNMKAVSVKDNAADVDGTVIQTVASDKLKGIEEVTGASNGYYIAEGDANASAGKSTTFSAPGVGSTYQMVEKVSQATNQDPNGAESSMMYLVVDEDGNVVHTTDQELDMDPEHVSEMINTGAIPNIKNNVASVSFGRFNTAGT